MTRLTLQICLVLVALVVSAEESSAVLKSANLTFAIMQGAILCNTTMPEGSFNDSGCWVIYS